MRNKEEVKIRYADFLICFAVFIQSALIIMQIVMAPVFNISLEKTTIYRVVLTGIFMSIAILIGFRRKPLLFFIAYSAVIVLLLIHMIIFPENEPYILSEAPRFLLPVVLPSALCLITIKNIDVVEKAAYSVAWIVLILVVIYVFYFFQGKFIIEKYNMSFSYGALLPMLLFYNHKTKLSLVLSFLLFIVVIAIGSRGAALIFMGFAIVDVFRKHHSYRVPVVLIAVAVISSVSLFKAYLSDWGISSRTLYMLSSGTAFEDSGREDLYLSFITKLLDNPLMGIGVYGDRIGTEGTYCHNLFLEILLDYGIFIGTSIIVYLFFFISKVYRKCRGHYRDLLLIFIFYGIGSLLSSSSYLQSSELAILIGFTILLNKNNSVRKLNVVKK